MALSSLRFVNALGVLFQEACFSGPAQVFRRKSSLPEAKYQW
jgi:hypothetical protein